MLVPPFGLAVCKTQHGQVGGRIISAMELVVSVCLCCIHT